MAAAVELRRDRETSGAGSDDSDRLAAASRRRFGDDPPFLERPLGDRQLDLLDRDRVVVDRQHARRFARRGADPASELGEVVRHVELVDRLAPLAAIDEVVPVRDQIPERAPLVAEGDAAVHAACALTRELVLRLQREVLLVVVHAGIGVALVEADPVDLEKSAEFAHGPGEASNATPP